MPANKINWRDIIQIDPEISEVERKMFEQVLDTMASDKDGIKILEAAKKRMEDLDDNKLFFSTREFTQDLGGDVTEKVGGRYGSGHLNGTISLSIEEHKTHCYIDSNGNKIPFSIDATVAHEISHYAFDHQNAGDRQKEENAAKVESSYSDKFGEPTRFSYYLTTKLDNPLDNVIIYNKGEKLSDYFEIGSQKVTSLEIQKIKERISKSSKLEDYEKDEALKDIEVIERKFEERDLDKLEKKIKKFAKGGFTKVEIYELKSIGEGLNFAEVKFNINLNGDLQADLFVDGKESEIKASYIYNSSTKKIEKYDGRN